MSIQEIVWNRNDWISCINQPIVVPFLIMRKPFNGVKKIITNGFKITSFNKKGSYLMITYDGKPFIEFIYRDGQLKKVVSKSWLCEYYYEENTIKIKVFSGKESNWSLASELFFTVNAKKEIIKKEIYTKWFDGKIYLDEYYHYRYLDGRLVEKREFAPKDYDQINFDPIYNGKYKLHNLVTYKYSELKNNSWKISQFQKDLENENRVTKFREYVFNSIGDLESNSTYSDQKTIYEEKNTYRYDANRNWIYKQQIIFNSNNSISPRVKDYKRIIEYY